MQVDTRQAGDVTVADFSGRAVDTEGALRDLMARLLADGRRRIVFDFTDLEYLDSTALGELVACQLRAIRAGSALKLAGVGHRVRDLLTMTRLLSVFDVHPTVNAAITSFER